MRAVTAVHSWRTPEGRVIGLLTPAAPPTPPPGGSTGWWGQPWPWGHQTASEGGAGQKTKRSKVSSEGLDRFHSSPWDSYWGTDLQEERQVGVSQVKVPPTGQHAVNHADERKQEVTGSAPFRRQVGQFNWYCRRSAVLQESHRLLNCTSEQNESVRGRLHWLPSSRDGWWTFTRARYTLATILEPPAISKPKKVGSGDVTTSKALTC